MAILLIIPRVEITVDDHFFKAKATIEVEEMNKKMKSLRNSTDKMEVAFFTDQKFTWIHTYKQYFESHSSFYRPYF